MSSSTVSEIQRRLDDLLDHIPAGVVVHGADGRILKANSLACELIGLGVEQLRGTASDERAWHLVAADGSRMTAEQFPVNRVLGTGRNQSDMLVGVSLDAGATVRWVICNAYPEKDAAGRIVQVVVCFTDCTGLKKAEQQLLKSEERLRLVLQGSTDAPWDYDLVADEMYYSDRWWDMLGYRPGELAAGTQLWLELAHPEDRSRVEAFLGEVLGSDENSYSFEFRQRHKEGHYVPILSRGFVLRDASGRPLRVSGTNTDLTERKHAEQRIHELAYFDHLTGLPNRRLLVEELNRALLRSQRSGRSGAVIFLDLDNFKLLNDTMGHQVGDLLLRQVAGRLRDTLRASDQLGRLGGDEFVLVLEELSTDVALAVEEVQHVLQKLLCILGEPYILNGRPFVSTASIGATLFQGTSVDIDTLLRQADLAMYGAKSDGRHTARFFDPDMQTAAERRAALERALREGLVARQFVLFCQPQFSAAGALVGAEILVRWQRDNGELVAPGEFIHHAESCGLIVPLGRYILEQSCHALARWRTDPALANIDLAVNVSAHQLRDDDIVTSLAAIVRQTGAPASRLSLELTESVFAEGAAGVIDRMHALCGQGIRFSLDDFGTGYSSLAYFKRFPLTALKIDRAFVHDVHHDADAALLVEAIIALAHKLELHVVAEGVEHAAQRDFLIGAGCNTLQGYLLGRPVPLHEFERMHGTMRMAALSG